MSDAQRKGRCLCGAVKFSITGEPNWVLHCHCESCRRATSSPMTTWVSVPNAHFHLEEGEPKFFQSSPGATRSFCPDCGSPLSFAHERWSGEIHLYAASFDDPDSFAPDRHVFFGERIGWMDVHDALPRFDSLSGGGREPDSLGPKAE